MRIALVGLLLGGCQLAFGIAPVPPDGPGVDAPDGAIDDVGIFDRALSVSEIISLESP